MADFEGDNHLSGNDRRCWELVYTCMMNFRCVVIFKHRTMYVPKSIGENYQFFVEAGGEMSLECKQFIEQETDDWKAETTVYDKENQQGMDRKDGEPAMLWPGTQVRVHFFSGLGVHVERVVMAEIISTQMDRFYADIANNN